MAWSAILVYLTSYILPIVGGMCAVVSVCVGAYKGLLEVRKLRHDLASQDAARTETLKGKKSSNVFEHAPLPVITGFKDTGTDIPTPGSPSLGASRVNQLDRIHMLSASNDRQLRRINFMLSLTVVLAPSHRYLRSVTMVDQNSDDPKAKREHALFRFEDCSVKQGRSPAVVQHSHTVTMPSLAATAGIETKS